MYVINSKRENSRAVAAGLVLAVRRPPVQKNNRKNSSKYADCTVVRFCFNSSIFQFFNFNVCSNKSKIEAAFRDKVSMSAVNTTFPFVDSAKLGTKKSIPLQCNEMLMFC